MASLGVNFERRIFMKKNIPAISVIIPMWNVEKYIGECLDSILNQTFQDFEIIVVDDCSTDNSCAVVEKFSDDRIKLIRNKKNSGQPGASRNIGMNFAVGEYIYFMDSDDIIIKTALEELYTVAKNFDADVIHCEKIYHFFQHDINNKTLRSTQTGEFVKEPTLITSSLVERVTDWINKRFVWSPVLKLIKRDYILKNNLRMSEVFMEDFIWTACLICSAEKYVRVPNVIYYYRIHEDSISLDKNRVSLSRRIQFLIGGFNYLNKFLSEREPFQQRKDLKYMMLNSVVKKYVEEGTLQLYEQSPVYNMNEFFLEEFMKYDDTKDLLAFIFNRMNMYNIAYLQQKKLFDKLQKQNQELQIKLQKLQAEK